MTRNESSVSLYRIVFGQITEIGNMFEEVGFCLFVCLFICRMLFSLWKNRGASSAGFEPFLHMLLSYDKVSGCFLLPEHGHQAV